MKLAFKLNTIYRTLRRFQKHTFQVIRFFVLRYNSDPLQALDKDALRNVTIARKQSRKAHSFMRRHRAEISALPPDYIYMFMGSYGARMHVGYAASSGDPEEIRSAVQKAIHATMAKRAVSSDSGNLSYTLNTNYFTVEIAGAKLAHGCELVEVEQTKTVFEISCPEGVEAMEVA